jgi:tetratricopeptide (TPR) repeat protein
LLAQLSIDAGATETGRPYFLMELVKGVSISQFSDKNQIPTRDRLELFMAVCKAVQHAHQKGVIHRDLKPSNILVTLHDGKPVPKVIDFGVAKALNQELTEKTLFTAYGHMVGTPQYMSPEQAEMSGLDVDTRSDIYSLGVLLYELLTGTTPLQAKRLRSASYAEMQRIICEDEPPSPSQRLSTLGEKLTVVARDRHCDPGRLRQILRGELDWIVMKALEKDRTRRYETANALARDIQRYLADEPVEACPPSAGYRLKKLVRKHRKLLGVVALCALLLAAGAAVSAWQAVRATVAEWQALTARDGETEQRKQAEKSQAESQAVLKFFQDKVLSAARPRDQEGGLGKDTTIRTALDKAEPEIAKAFGNQPLVEAAIRHTLGQTYDRLDERSLALRQLERALALRRQVLGSEHPDTLTSMHGMALALMNAGRREEGVKLHEGTLQLRRRILGPEHPDTLASTNDVAVILQHQGRLEEARRLLDETLRQGRRTLGPEHTDTLASMNNVAEGLRRQGRLEEARKLHHETLQLRRRILGPEHPDTLWSMNNLALVLSAQHRLEEARKLHEETLRLRRRILGPEHGITIWSMDNLAMVLQDQGREEEAYKLYDEALRLAQRTLGPEHPGTLTSMNALAWLLATAADRKLRDPARAVELAKEVVSHTPKSSAYQDTLGAEWNTLGAAQYAAGNWKEAITALDKSMGLRDGGGDSNDWFFLAMAHWQLGDKVKARSWYDKAVQWMNKNQPKNEELRRIRAEAEELLQVKNKG